MGDIAEQDCCECGTDCGECGEAVAGDLSGAMAAELAEVRGRLARVENALQMLAKRRICALMTDVDALERHVLERQVTTADLKKAGLRAMGLDRKG